MFRPRTSPISREDFLDTDKDLVIDDTGVQGVIGGALRLLPILKALVSQDFSWTTVPWDLKDELNFPDNIDSRWEHLLNDLPAAPGVFDFDPYPSSLEISTDPTSSEYLRQKAGGPVGKTFWPDHVDNTVGWTVQTRVNVVGGFNDDGDLDETPGHRLVLDDGTRREVLRFSTTGISFENNPALNISVDLRGSVLHRTYREIRIGARGDDIFVLLDNGQGVAGVDGFTGLSLAKELGFGIPTLDTGHHITVFDYLYQFHQGDWVDERPNVITVFSTDGSTAVTNAFFPKNRVRRFDEALVESTGDLAGGDTTVVVEYRSSATSDLWVQLSSTLIDTIGIKRISLSNIPVAADRTDQVRFKITQVSADGSTEAPRVERITVLTTFGESGFAIIPRWGPTSGGTTHLIDMLTGADISALGAGPYTGLLFLAPLDSDFVDTQGNLTGTPTGDTEFVPGSGYNGAVQLGSITGTADLFTNILASFAESAPFGQIGSGLDPVFVSGALALAQGSVWASGASQAAQRVAADAGNGVKLSGYTGPGAVRFVLQIVEGAVEVLFNGVTRTFDIYDFWTPRSVVIDVAGSSDLEFKAIGGNATFLIAPQAAYTRATRTVDFGSPAQPSSGLGVDVFFKPSILEAGEIFSRLNGNDGWELGLSAAGVPYATFGDGTALDSIDGAFPLRVDERFNLALNYRAFLDHTGIQLLVNDEIVAEKITTLGQPTAGTSLELGGVVGEYDQLRIHDGPLDALRFGVANGLANPAFQSAFSVPRSSDNKLILRFSQTKGVFADDSGRDHHAGLLHEWRTGLHRSEKLGSGISTLFWFNGGLVILHTPDFIQDMPIGIFARGLFRLPAQTQELASKWNAGETVGWKIEILDTGQVLVTVKDGTTIFLHQSEEILADDTEKSVHVQIDSDGIVLRVGDVETSFSESIDSLAAATEDMFIGRGLTAYLVEFVFRKATLSMDEYSQWADPAYAKWSPSDDVVLVDGVAIPNSQVLHYSATRKYVIMPPHAPGGVNVLVRTQGVTLDTARPFIYALSFQRLVDLDDTSLLPTMHSPFRIVPMVPRGSIALATIQTPDISVEKHVSLTDLSYLTSENLSTYFGGMFPVTGPETGAGSVSYTGQIDTDDVRVSNRSVMKRSVKEPTPLFYRYVIGRGRRFVFQENAVSASDVDVIRRGIEILDGNGQKLAFDKYPWDIAVSDVDEQGNALPLNTFAVTLFAEISFLQDVSVLVRYSAADSLYRFQLQPNFTEFINVEPMMGQVEETPGYDQFLLPFQDDGTYDLEVGTTGL